MPVVIEEIELEEKRPIQCKKIFKILMSFAVIGSSACSFCALMCDYMRGE